MYDPNTRSYQCERKKDQSGNPNLIFYFAVVLILAAAVAGVGSTAINAQAHRDPHATGVLGWVEQADKDGVQRGRVVWPWEDLRSARVTRD